MHSSTHRRARSKWNCITTSGSYVCEFAITEKVFPTLTGDGTSTFEQLLEKDERASLIASTYQRRFSKLRGRVLETGQQIRLVEAGNHCQGCIFRDGMHLHTEALERAIDEISQRLSGFFIGRYDIRYENEDEFKQGRNFQIVELNGATLRDGNGDAAIVAATANSDLMLRIDTARPTTGAAHVLSIDGNSTASVEFKLPEPPAKMIQRMVRQCGASDADPETRRRCTRDVAQVASPHVGTMSGF